MQPCVHHQFIPLREPLLAELARVGPRVRVDALVLSKEVSPLEVLGAVHALVRTLARVGATVVKDKLRSEEKRRESQICAHGSKI